MTVTITAGVQNRVPGAFQELETMTQSTATAPQAISVAIPVTILGMGTATGAAVRNLYTLPPGIEGQEKWVYTNATGEASLIATFPTTGRLPLGIAFTNNPTATTVDALLASATGQLVFQAAGEFVHLRYFNACWHIRDAYGVTIATTT